MQLARLFAAKGSYLSANSGWPRRADWGGGAAGKGTDREEPAEAATGEETGGGGRGGGEEDKGSRQSYPALSSLPQSL